MPAKHGVPQTMTSKGVEHTGRSAGSASRYQAVPQTKTPKGVGKASPNPLCKRVRATDSGTFVSGLSSWGRDPIVEVPYG